MQSLTFLNQGGPMLKRIDRFQLQLFVHRSQRPLRRSRFRPVAKEVPVFRPPRAGPRLKRLEVQNH